ncbi:uncharacterized protein At4g18490 isoform X2 [Malania oleifera]|uniref:uncharacterized protein At4g18490 isoform X2 n=1 Tax=Malania oleifera TaxID=397392 RepID=UPI0025AE6EB2|nr:uncharacterized protein At4g18490 isoform X2 [Malania oleifera]XP_057949075.1 uncharacterized protein At4g18490 isoform X2 [Malania oleifera]
MSDSQKGASSSVDAKKKTPSLDEEIGKEFLSSWKSISVTDDAIDFDFETVTQGKKKAFSFDKLDMDFNLDGGFDKISSFKVDMPDLDFSCQPKKTGKAKERSEDSASGNHQPKQDHFAFSFDFNDFSFDSSLMKEEKKSNKSQDNKGVALDKSESTSKGSKNRFAEGTSAFDDSTILELPPLGSGTTSKVETPVDGHGNLDSGDDNCPSKSMSANLGVSPAAETLVERTPSNAEETDQENQPLERTVSTKTYAQQINGVLPVQSASGNDSIQDTVSELQTEVCVLDTKVNGNSDGEQTISAKTVPGLGPNREKSRLKDSLLPLLVGPQNSNGEGNALGSDNHALLGSKDDPEPNQGDSGLEDTSITSVSKSALHGSKAHQENHNSTSKFFLAPLNSDKLEEKSRVIDSKFFKRSEELHQASSTCSTIISRGGKSVGTTHLSSADERREEFNADDTQIGNKPVVRSHSTELTDEKHALLGNENSVKDLSSIRDCVCSDDAQNGSKLVGCSGPHDKDVAQGEPLLLGSEKVNVQKTSSAPVNCSGSTGQTIKSSTQKCVNPKLMVSSMASKRTLNISSLEGIKFSSLKAAKRTPDQSSLKSSRMVGLNKDLSSSTFHRQTKSLQKTEQEEQVQGHVTFRTASSVTPEKRTTPTLSLKRKTLEETNVDPVALNPSKRLSESPNESRKLKGASGGLIAEQVCSNANVVDDTAMDVDYDHTASTSDTLQEVNMTMLEIPLGMENDGNVEKAEAFSKELENICNMLKKKHDEAKELLVRAIVNNNNLLMLNHPIYEEKISFQLCSLLHSFFHCFCCGLEILLHSFMIEYIRMVQKFATQLMSREFHT